MTYTPFSLIKPAVYSSQMVALKEWIYAFHMPMFVFVSGCVFAFQLEVLKKKYTLKGLVTNKIKRLIVPFYSFALLLVVPTMSLLGFREPVHYFIDGFVLLVDPRHLWYVAMLFAAFILFFMLRWITEKCNVPQWSILILALFMYFLPTVTIYFQIGNLQEYFLWFVYGYFIVENKIMLKYLTILAVISLIVSFFISIPHVIEKLTYAILGISVFYYFAVKKIGLRLVGGAEGKFYKTISRNGFGIYLFHAMIIYWLEYWLQASTIHPVILSVGVFILTLLLSIALTELTRAIYPPPIG